jgi:hypothetical protein
MYIVEELFSVGKDSHGMFCNNEKCGRFGLFTAVSTPEALTPETDKKEVNDELSTKDTV